MRRYRFFLWVPVSGLLSCAGDESKTPVLIDDTADSAATGDSDADTDTDTDTDSDTDPPFDGVTARYIDRYIGPDGSVTEQDRDPFAGLGLIQMRVYAPDGTSTLYPAMLSVPGTLEFAGVPAQTWVLERYGQPDMELNLPGRQDFIEATAREIDFGADFAGRPDVDLATLPLPLTLDIDGLLPLQISGYDALNDLQYEEQDRIEIHSFTADALGIVAPDPADPAQISAPARGGTALSGFTFDWPAVSTSAVHGGPVLLEAPDDLTITQVAETLQIDSGRSDPWSRFLWRTPVAAWSGSADMIDGQPAALSGTMSALTPADWAVDLRASAIAALLAAPGPLSSACVSFSMTRDPGSAAPITGVGPTLLSFAACAAEDGAGGWTHPGDLLQTFPVGDPWLSGAPVIHVLSAVESRYTDLAGGSETASAWISMLLPAVDGQPVEPILGPVQNLRVNGQEARTDSPLTGVGAQPVITFDAPAVGTPDYYAVILRDIDDVQDGTGAVVYERRTVATWTTAEREVIFPQGLLGIGKSYDIQVQAILGAPIDSWRSAPSAVAQQATGRITP